MIHYVSPLDPDDTPLGSDSSPDVMDDDDITTTFPRPMGVRLDLELRLRDWSTVGPVCSDVAFSEIGWQRFLDKLLSVVKDTASSTTEEPR